MRPTIRLTLPWLCAAALLAGCSSTTPPPSATPSAGAALAQPAAAAAATAPVASPSAAPAALPDYLDPKNPLYVQRSVHFDLDSFVIPTQDRPVVQRHGSYLAAHPGLAIRVEGNADERGSAEYNLALGQKRAEAVVAALKLMGAKDRQMEAISWGKEHPRATGHDEAAWSENRRVDLVYPGR